MEHREEFLRSGWGRRLMLGVALAVVAGPEWLAAAVKSEPQAKKPSSAPAPDFGLPQVALINSQIRDSWTARELTPSEAASDNEWCRRVHLDLLGRVPTIVELHRYLADSPAERKKKLVNRLLGEEYAEQYAHNWTTLWTNILIGRRGGLERRTLISRDGMKQSLRRAFERNMPYNQLVYNLVSATGRSKPGEENFNGFVNFLAGNLAENGVEATAKTGQIFLGVQVRCTQCHNHPFNDWKQNQFWELNAFFRQTGIERTRGGRKGRDTEYIDLVNRNFNGEDNRPTDAALFYELRNGLMKLAYPSFLDGQKLRTNSGYIEEVDRRTELAQMIAKSDFLPRAIVNRYWAHYLGYGFTKPIDDLGPHNAPSHPELLDGLAGEFRKYSYDLKALTRWIVLSEPYSLSSKGGSNAKDDPQLGEKPMFSHFYLRQMRAEELFESLLVATQAEQTKNDREAQEDLKERWLGQFTIAFGTDENDETTTFNGTIPQALMMMNGDLVENATNIRKGSFLGRLAANGKLDNKDKITYLYEAALARKPNHSETSAANQLLRLRGGDAAAALQDVWWAILNSNEFILNH